MTEHLTLSPEQAARCLARYEQGDERTIAADLREHVETYGPVEVEIGGTLYTVWIEDQ